MQGGGLLPPQAWSTMSPHGPPSHRQNGSPNKYPLRQMESAHQALPPPYPHLRPSSPHPRRSVTPRARCIPGQHRPRLPWPARAPPHAWYRPLHTRKHNTAGTAALSLVCVSSHAGHSSLCGCVPSPACTCSHAGTRHIMHVACPCMRSCSHTASCLVLACMHMHHLTHGACPYMCVPYTYMHALPHIHTHTVTPTRSPAQTHTHLAHTPGAVRSAPLLSLSG